MRPLLALLAFAVGSAARPRASRSFHYTNDIRGGAGVQLSPLPKDVIRPEQLPVQFDWRDIDGQSYVTPTQNQYSPDECGSCWAHASASALSDRIKRLRNGTWPDIVLSAQVLLN